MILIEDGFSIQKGTGIGYYTINLFDLLKNHSKLSDVHLIEKEVLSKISSPILRRIFYTVWLNTWFQLYARKLNPKVVHFTNYLIPLLRLSRAKYVVTVHDLTAWRFPETLPPSYVAYLKKVIPRALISADLIFTDSNAVKDEILKYFQINSGKIRTVYTTAISDFWEMPPSNRGIIETVKKKFGIAGDFILFVGTLEERKNLTTLVKAFSMLQNWKDLTLVLVGRPGYGFLKLRKLIEQKNLTHKVIIPGYIDMSELIALYDSARVFAYPSLYEGFGIPLLEAMTRGLPIVASRISSSEEVAASAALYYEDPLNSDDLANQIFSFLKSEQLAAEFSTKGKNRANFFSQARVGELLSSAYKPLYD